MPQPQVPNETTTKVKHGVAIFLFLGIGLLVGTVAAVAYLFTTK